MKLIASIAGRNAPVDRLASSVVLGGAGIDASQQGRFIGYTTGQTPPFTIATIPRQIIHKSSINSPNDERFRY